MDSATETEELTAQKGFQPNDFDAEKQVIGACLLSAPAVTAALSSLRAEDFFFRTYGWAFEAIRDLSDAGSPISSKTVALKLSEAKGLSGSTRLAEVGGAEFLGEAMDGNDPTQCAYWAGRVRKKKAERDLLGAGEWLRQTILGGTADMVKVRAEFEERVAKLSLETSPRVVAARDAGTEIMELIDRYIQDPDAIYGLETGWAALDRLLDGFKPGNVSIVYAPSSRFKSFFTLNIGWRLARKGIPGLWYSTEMPRIQVQERLTSLECGMNIRWARRDGSISRRRQDLKDAAQRAAALPIFYCDADEMDVSSIKSDILRYVQTHHVEYVIVDLVDFVSMSGDPDETTMEQSRVMKKMKSIARKAGIHIFLVTHVSKGDKALRKAASLDVEEMKGSSGKYQDVDVAISLMPVTQDPATQEWIGLDRKEIKERQKKKRDFFVLVSVTKNRHGELDDIIFKLSFEEGGRMHPANERKMTQSALPNAA